jgi:hypothetical protein
MVTIVNVLHFPIVMFARRNTLPVTNASIKSKRA